MDRFILLLDPYEYLITPFGDHEILNFTLLSKIVPATFFFSLVSISSLQAAAMSP